MTILLYQSDSYLRNFEAIVTSVDMENNGISLNQTGFYPGGGGQPADRGMIETSLNQYTIIRAKRIGEQLVHLVSENDNLPHVGDSVTGTLDWEHRYRLMRTHTAMHILCGVIFRDYGASVTGGDMDPLMGRMDFEFETMHKDLVLEIEARVNAEVARSREIRTAILPREEAFKIPDLIHTKINLLPEGIQEIRVVEIVGLDLQADGGTHVNNTIEVGHMRITDYKSKGKINKRIYVALDS
jgi:misacylated tRNA(Ala) deacylase